MKNAFKQLFCLLLVFACVVLVSSCQYFPVGNPDLEYKPEQPEQPEQPGEDKVDLKEKYNAITVAEAIELTKTSGEEGQVAKVYGIVNKTPGSSYGDTYLTDGTNEFYVYGIEGYKDLSEKLAVGDEVVLEGVVKMYNGTPEMVKGTILEFVKGQAPDIELPDPEDVLTVSEALEIAVAAGEAGTSVAYAVSGTVKNVTNSNYGEMYITDGVNELYIYGINGYNDMEDKPVQGYEVVLSGILKVFKDSPEMGKADLISFVAKKPEINEEDYKVATIQEARESAEGTLVKLTGVVAQITYANGMAPNGIMLVDNTNSIYVYGKDVAGQVEIGNTITIVGSKTFYVLEKEQSYADKFGYKGCNQIENAYLLENDKQVSEYNKEWISETTVKEIMETPWTEDITTTIYKVTALVKKVEGTGFTNYYIDDLDGFTGSYTYSQASGSDFAWLDQFDGKICTVYLSVQNAKASTSGCIWRFLPIEVIDEGYVFDEANAPEFAIKYYVLDQFKSEYTSDPAVELITQVSNELLQLEGIEIKYESSNEDVVYFEITTSGVATLHTKNYGEAKVTITATYKGYTASKEIEIAYTAPVEYDYVTVKEAFEAADDEIVIVRGIVAGGVINKDGFYIIDETGAITATSTKEVVGALSVGDEVVIRGRKGHNDKTETVAGQANLYDAEVLVNYYGGHQYSTASFTYGKTFAELSAIPVIEDHSSEIYVVTGSLSVYVDPKYTSMTLKDKDGNTFPLYMSSANQYSWLHAYSDQELTIVMALCNWNKKSAYRGCILAITTEDGQTIYNTYNLLG